MSKDEAQSNRMSAMLAGVKFYIGRPCQHGHRQRYVATKHCRLCIIDRLRAGHANHKTR
jgi:hypothetical protein